MTGGEKEQRFSASRWADDLTALVPDRCMFLFQGKKFSAKDVSEYSKVWRASLSAAQIEPGQVIAIAGERSIEAVTLFLSCLQSGVLPFFVDPRLEFESLVKLLDAVRIHGLYCGNTLDSSLFAARLPYLRWMGEQDARSWTETQGFTGTTTEQSPAFVNHSAGTCALPRALFHGADAIAWQSSALASQLRIRQGTEVWYTGTLASAAVLSLGMFAALSANATFVLDDPSVDLAKSDSDAKNRLLLLAEARDQNYWTAERLLQLKGKVSSVLVTDSSLTEEFALLVTRATDGQVWSGYYTAESAGFVALNTLPGVWPFESVGRPIGGAVFTIVGENGERLPSGSIGRLGVSNAPRPIKSVSLSFKSSSSRDESEWLPVEDWAVLDDQDFLRIVGCDRAVFLKGGFQVRAEDLEVSLKQLDGVSDAVVYAKPHEEIGSEVAASLILSDSHVDPSNIPRLLDAKLPRFMVPSALSIVTELASTPSGKRIRYGLATAGKSVDQLKPLPELVLPSYGPKLARTTEEDSGDESLPIEDV